MFPGVSSVVPSLTAWPNQIVTLVERQIQKEKVGKLLGALGLKVASFKPGKTLLIS